MNVSDVAATLDTTALRAAVAVVDSPTDFLAPEDALVKNCQLAVKQLFDLVRR